MHSWAPLLYADALVLVSCLAWDCSRRWAFGAWHQFAIHCRLQVSTEKTAMLVFQQRKLVLSRLPNPYDIDKPLQKANRFKHSVLTLDTQN